MTQQYPPHQPPQGWQQYGTPMPRQAPAPQWAPPSADPRQSRPITPPVAPPKPPKKSHGKLGALALLVVGLAAACVLTSPSKSGAPATSTAPTWTGSGASATHAALSAAPVAPIATGPAKKITAREWQFIAKDPAAHTGDRVIVYGQVTQFDATTGTEGFRANIDGIEHKAEYGYADYDTNTIVTGDVATLKDVVEGDLFKAEVTVAGAQSYETTMGGTLTAPMLTVTSIDIIGHV